MYIYIHEMFMFQCLEKIYKWKAILWNLVDTIGFENLQTLFIHKYVERHDSNILIQLEN